MTAAQRVTELTATDPWANLRDCREELEQMVRDAEWALTEAIRKAILAMRDAAPLDSPQRRALTAAAREVGVAHR